MLEKIKNYLQDNIIVESLVEHAIVLALAILIYFLVKRFIFRALVRLVEKSKNKYDDMLLEHLEMSKIAFIPSLVVIYYYLNRFGDDFSFLQDILFVLMAFFILKTISSALNALNDIYNDFRDEKSKPIKGYIQLIQLFLYVIGSIIVVGSLIDQSPLTILSGVGAFTAVLLLIFRDTILSLVASVQISTNDLLHVGDWIEMPSYGVDGDVMDIALHTVKIRNFDKTITTVPTHKFIEQSFKNWRGMTQSGGRRIKRSIYIDMDSIHHYRDEEIQKLKENDILKSYLESKESELNQHNQKAENHSELAKRRLTNIGTFRNYLIFYLTENPDIRNDMTLLVRQLEPSTRGLPLEIYCFANTTAWSEYESIQANLFDHIISVASLFKLKLFQELKHG